MKISELSLVPLRYASLCLDCETITAAHINCHACGSRALLNVARALNRPHVSDQACSGRTAVVQMGPRVRHTSHRGVPGLSRGRENALARRLDFNMSETSA